MNVKILQWRSLKTRVTLLTLAIFLISIWSIAFYSTHMLREDMEHLLGDQQFSTETFIAEGVTEELEKRIRSMESVAPLFSTAIQHGNIATLQTLLERRPILQTLFNGGTFVTGIDGIAIADVPLSTERIGVNFSDRDYLVGAIKEGEATIGKPIMGLFSKSPIFVIAVPIRDPEGKVIGALMGVTDLGKPNFLNRITDNHYGKTGDYRLPGLPWFCPD